MHFCSELTAKRAADAEPLYRSAAAAALTAERMAAAKQLEKAAVLQINDLAMNARFHIEVKGRG